MITKEQLSNALGQGVYLADVEVPWLWEKVKDLTGTIVEIGAGYGASASIFLMASKSSVYSIDSFEGDTIRGWKSSLEECRNAVISALSKFGYWDRYDSWKIIPQPSLVAVKDWKSQIDLLFIDGDHRYVPVRGDYEAWFPHVKKQGKIVIHDSMRDGEVDPLVYSKGWPGPTQLAVELRENKEVKFIEFCHSSTLWEKL